MPIHQHFPLSKFCAIQQVVVYYLAAHMTPYPVQYISLYTTVELLTGNSFISITLIKLLIKTSIIKQFLLITLLW